MPHQNFMQSGDLDRLAMLQTFDGSIAGLAAKYGITAEEMDTVHQNTLAWEWWIQTAEVVATWAQGVTATKLLMRNGPAGPSQNTGGGPNLPVTPSVPQGGGNVSVVWMPGFFAWFGALVARIKANVAYLDADGQVLGIVGAEIQPPDPATTVPALKVTIVSGGMPETNVPKGPFDGYYTWIATNGGAEVQAQFSTTAKRTHQVPPPPAGTAVLLTFRVQYVYKGDPFGQKSAPVSVTLHG